MFFAELFFHLLFARAASQCVAAFADVRTKLKVAEIVYFVRRASTANEARMAPVMLSSFLFVPDQIWILRPQLGSLAHYASQSNRAGFTYL